MLTRLLAMPVVVLALGLVACGDDDGEEVAPASTAFPEGSMRIEIETLDTGLLKGHAFADAEDGWTVATFSVEAHDDSGVVWQVIEPEVTGVGTASVSEFFEVVIQELPRGEQLTVEAVAILRNESGAQIERRVVDNWPP